MRRDRVVDRRALGDSGLEVSRLSLGSWRTFERIGRERGLAVMRAAREHGINFLDDARYNDETGNAPIPTGYSEVLFGELFRAAGWDRGDTIVSNKLWWEFWPEQSAREELAGSLQRMGFDYADVIYANPPPDGLPVTDMVAAVGALVQAGMARAWAIVNWQAEPFREASEAARRHALPQPCAAQLPYSFAQRDWVEGDAMRAALEASGAGVVASFVMAGGVLTGKYESGGSGRHSADVEDASLAARREAGRRLRALASEAGVSPAALAIAFALRDPAVATVLFGATSGEQIAENAGALTVSGEIVERVATLE
jgi:aryl-alcohol dehydrogenase-like predicted oxidoreductase